MTITSAPVLRVREYEEDGPDQDTTGNVAPCREYVVVIHKSAASSSGQKEAAQQQQQEQQQQEQQQQEQQQQEQQQQEQQQQEQQDGLFVTEQQEEQQRRRRRTPTETVTVTTTTTTTTTTTQLIERWLFRGPRTVCKELFLPIGYPHTVEEGYLEYQFYDSLQGLCSYLRGVLCSAQVFQAAGVGNDEATAWAAAVTWALKDGMGMMGGLLFSYVCSPWFDAYTKEFRLFADIINDVGLTLDMVAPYLPRRQLLWISSASTLCKTLCGMSAAATKANITHYFARQGNNMADLNAKESTQETLVSLTGMALGVILARHLQHLEQSHSEIAQQIQWTVFLTLTALHVWANWKGVVLLHLPTLNRPRTELVLREIFHESSTTQQQQQPQQQPQVTVKPLNEISVPSPRQIKESLWTSTQTLLWPRGRIQLGSRLIDMVSSSLSSSLDWMEEFVNERYLLNVTCHGIIQVCLLRGAQPADELKAFCHAYLCSKSILFTDRAAMTYNNTRATAVVRQCHQLLEPLFDDTTTNNNSRENLLSVLHQKGWHVQGRLYLGFPRRRSEWIRNKNDNDATNKKTN